MSTQTVLVLLAEGFEEIEAITPIDLLRRAGSEVTAASLAEGIHVTGRSGITLHATTSLSAVSDRRFDCVVLPGGPGVRRLRDDARVLDLVRGQSDSSGWIAAICAAPLVLKDAGILEGRRFTAHDSVRSELPAALFDERLVVDGRLITSRGAGTSLDFALSIVGNLFSPEKALEVSNSIRA